jgi:hypothetical protein
MGKRLPISHCVSILAAACSDLLQRQCGGVFMHWQTIRAVALCAWFTVPAFAQQPASSQPLNSTCVFEDGRQTRISYTPEPDNPKKRDLPRDKMWTPGNQPMTLFTDAALTLAGTAIFPGAYSMYIIPSKDKWILVLNKDVTPDHQYDVTQDLVRAPMETGQLPDSQAFQLAFARMKPTQCSLRIYYGKIGVWAEFNEP